MVCVLENPSRAAKSPALWQSERVLQCQANSCILLASKTSRVSGFAATPMSAEPEARLTDLHIDALAACLLQLGDISQICLAGHACRSLRRASKQVKDVVRLSNSLLA